jgi:hypothetical protein
LLDPSLGVHHDAAEKNFPTDGSSRSFPTNIYTIQTAASGADDHAEESSLRSVSCSCPDDGLCPEGETCGGAFTNCTAPPSSGIALSSTFASEQLSTAAVLQLSSAAPSAQLSPSAVDQLAPERFVHQSPTPASLQSLSLPAVKAAGEELLRRSENKVWLQIVSGPSEKRYLDIVGESVFFTARVCCFLKNGVKAFSF